MIIRRKNKTKKKTHACSCNAAPSYSSLEITNRDKYPGTRVNRHATQNRDIGERNVAASAVLCKTLGPHPTRWRTPGAANHRACDQQSIQCAAICTMWAIAVCPQVAPSSRRSDKRDNSVFECSTLEERALKMPRHDNVCAPS